MTEESPSPSASSRKFISVLFDCCNVYTRVYINREETAYVGKCPKCLGQVTAEIGPNGTNTRMFRAG